MRLQRLTNFLFKYRGLSLVVTFAATLIGTNVNQFKNGAPLSIVLFGFLIGLSLCTLSIVIAALITLVQGIYLGLLFTLAATLPYMMMFFLNRVEDGTSIAMFIGLGVAIAGNLFTWFFAVMLHKRMSWEQVIQLGTLAIVLIISVVHLAMPGIDDWWGQQLQMLQTAILKMNPKTIVMSSADIAVSKQFVNGMIGAFVLLSAISQLILARWWQFAVFKSESLSKELHNIRLNPLAGILFLFSLIFSYLGNSVVLDIMPVLYVLFGMAGLSLIHCLFRKFGASKSWFWLFVMYIAFFFAQPISIMLIAMLALVDTWLDVRKRFNKV